MSLDIWQCIPSWSDYLLNIFFYCKHLHLGVEKRFFLSFAFCTVLKTWIWKSLPNIFHKHEEERANFHWQYTGIRRVWDMQLLQRGGGSEKASYQPWKCLWISWCFLLTQLTQTGCMVTYLSGYFLPTFDIKISKRLPWSIALCLLLTSYCPKRFDMEGQRPKHKMGRGPKKTPFITSQR